MQGVNQGKSYNGISNEEIVNIYHLAQESMAVLNKNAAVLLHKHQAHGATDVTGFGILGHAKNLAAAQIWDVDIIIE